MLRCPFCFFLLEIPNSVLKMVKDAEPVEQKIKIIEEEEVKKTKMRVVPEEEVEKINASCSYCHNIFLKENRVLQCENCGIFYHEPCVQKMYEEIKACRNCGAQISIDK